MGLPHHMLLSVNRAQPVIENTDYSALNWGEPTSGNCTVDYDHRIRWELDSTPAGWTVKIEKDEGGGWTTVTTGLSLTNGSPGAPWTGQYNDTGSGERDTESGSPQTRKYRVTLEHATLPDVGPDETNTQTSIGEITACFA